jgi:hypothetical protein
LVYSSKTVNNYCWITVTGTRHKLTKRFICLSFNRSETYISLKSPGVSDNIITDTTQYISYEGRKGVLHLGGLEFFLVNQYETL